MKAKFPKSTSVFSTVIPVLYNHLNYGNHVGINHMLALLQETKMRFLKTYGMTETSIDGNVGYLIVNAEISQRAQAFHGDELQVNISIDFPNKKNGDFYFQIINNKTDQLIALAKTHVCFYDFNRKKIVNVPSNFLKIARP